ncbi:MAG: hypothetical protein Q9186_000141 [Xanthomendoza sp. 1 TL-2023]
MLLAALTTMLAASYALPPSPDAIKALSNPEYYEQLSSRFQQSLLQPNDIFKSKSSDDTCGPSTVCPSYEGKTEEINGREYNIYCFNAPWGDYGWLPNSKSLSECEAHCHQHKDPCNVRQTLLQLLKQVTIGAVPTSNQAAAFGPGGICPLPGADNQVWYYGAEREYPFKISCTNAFKVPASAKKSLGLVGEVDECALPCAKDKGCYGFHWYQAEKPSQRGRSDGKRECEHITRAVGENEWTGLYMPNQYMAGLKIEGRSDCGDMPWIDKGTKRA